MRYQPPNHLIHRYPTSDGIGDATPDAFGVWSVKNRSRIAYNIAYVSATRGIMDRLGAAMAARDTDSCDHVGRAGAADYDFYCKLKPIGWHTWCVYIFKLAPTCRSKEWLPAPARCDIKGVIVRVRVVANHAFHAERPSTVFEIAHYKWNQRSLATVRSRQKAGKSAAQRLMKCRGLRGPSDRSCQSMIMMFALSTADKNKSRAA